MLCRTLGGHLRLRVNIHGHFHRAVPQQLLHHLDIFPVCLQKRRVGAPEGVPGNTLVDAESLDHRLDVITHDGRQPKRLLPAFLSSPAAVGGKDPSWPLALLESHNSDTSETAKVGAKHIGHGFGKDLNFCGRSSVLRKVLSDIAHRAHDQVACHGTSRL